MPVPTHMPRAAGLTGRTEPDFAERAEVAVVAHRHRHMESPFQMRSDGHAGQAHVGRADDAGGVGSTTPGTAMPMAVRSAAATPPFSRTSLTSSMTARLFRAAGPRGGAAFALEDSPDSRISEEDLRAADIDAEVQKFCPLPCLS